MIAPLRETETPKLRPSPALRAARQAVAAALLRKSEDQATGPRVPAWQAWSLTAWAALVVGYWLIAMWNSWR